ncbi:zinc finger protein 33B-like [Achroia grisella]|uniref:zinc finger protein 33B-like n=1 Tax=Achroia grisella TaxID=688607 RepID=UPI0027D21C5E|nr:zinc finger protein 33B-like [Achroia grisella]
MTSDESDDEPLSVLAAAKKSNPYQFETNFTDEDYGPRKKRKKAVYKTDTKKASITIKLHKKRVLPPKVIERPTDVWLYMKDLNPTGPYSCLLCPEWFINRAKMIIHYVLNHKKDFCGICRYFVPDRDSWWAHLKFHIPWPCSQCIENFETEAALRQHLSVAHKLVHCRLCHFRVSDDDQYKTHLLQKHNVTNGTTSIDDENMWELDYEGGTKFFCLLCTKANNLSTTFFNHYMGYHHFTLKCFTNVISGRDPPFSVFGADVSSQFIDGQLKNQVRFGYVDLENKVIETRETENNEASEMLNVFVPEIKHEVITEVDDKFKEDDKESDEIKKRDDEIVKNYKGDEDFDVTLMELILLEKCYFNYVSQTLDDINSNTVPIVSDINYEAIKTNGTLEVTCVLCNTKLPVQEYPGHVGKMHSVKSVPMFSCRVCATTFDSHPELETHVTEELADFDDLWICQFCDKEFDNRESTRKHLIEHLDIMEYDNCFSPHLGFKCKYCPTLFWNETDREKHQVQVHFDKYQDQYYKCRSCLETYSDKVWFIHHYLEKHQNIEEAAPSYLLKCCLCCLVMTTVEEMREHFQDTHPEARKVFCSLDSCQYKPLSHRKSFKLHIRTVHTVGGRPERAAQCAVCGREFPSSRACSTHVAQAHGPGKYKCKLCREVMHTMDERKLHYLLRHPGRHPFECSECGKSFQYKSSLYMHKQDHAPNKQTFTCDYCGKVFMKKDSFREHVQIHEGPRHACSYCPMRFVQRSNMLRHERRHTGERPYACPECPRTFADKGACTSHARTHSKDTSYACLYCGQTFVQKSKLTYHIRKHTGENLETCPICSKMFTSACSLREHMKIHQARKGSVKCPLCDKTYQDERYMLRHLRTTHTRSHFSCPICNKSLSSTAGLRHHVLTHSSINTYRCKVCPKSYAVRRTIVKHLRKRHGIKDSVVNIKDFYRKMDPRECELGLEEEVMNSIFGPPKKENVFLANFVTFKKLDLPEESPKENANDDEGDDEEDGDEESDDGKDEDTSKDGDESNDFVKNKVIKQEPIDNEELEPTDFVSVKIEHVEANTDEEN